MLKTTSTDTKNTTVTKIERRTELAVRLEEFALVSVLFPAAIVTLAVIVFALGGPMSAWILPVSVVLAIVGLRLFSNSWQNVTLLVSVAAVTHVAAFALARFFFDSSWDGLAYHQEGVLRLAAGWNPFSESATAYGEDPDVRNDIRIEHFPKASWIAGAAVFLNCGRIEPSKLFNFTFIAAAAGHVAALLLRLTMLRISNVVAIALLAACNPVAVYQSTTFCVDGAVSSCLTLAVAGIVSYITAPRWLPLVIALLAICLMINLKFTGIPFAAVILWAGVVAVWYRRRLRSACRLAGLAAATGVVAVFAIGYAPYVRNVGGKGDMFYPLRGKNLPNLAPGRPANLVHRDRFTSFLIANLSRSEPTGWPPRTTRLKFPFWIYNSERSGWIWSTSPEAGGFGPLYGALLLLAGAGVVVLMRDASNRSIGRVVLLIAGVLAISVFVHQEAWKARFAPQAWLLPLIVATGCLLARQPLRVLWLGWVLIGVSVVNVLFIGAYFVWYQWKFTRDTRHTLQEASAVPHPVFVHRAQFQGLRQRFREAGVEIKLLANSPPAETAITRHRIPSPGPHTFWSSENPEKNALPP